MAILDRSRGPATSIDDQIEGFAIDRVPGRRRRPIPAISLVLFGNATALALIVAVPTIDLLVPPHIHLAPMLFVAPALTATFGRPRTTALVGVSAVMALVADATERRALATEHVIAVMLSLVALSALLVLFCHLRERHERNLARVRRVTEETQRVLLRPLPERAGPVSIAAAYHAAEAHTLIGGDLYAVVRSADSTRLIIGDVSGKGLATISDTAVMLEAFRCNARRCSSLTEMVACLADGVQWGMAEFADAKAAVAERFVTAIVADIPDDEPVVHLVSCGHPPPLLLRHGEAIPFEVREPAPPLGMSVLSRGSYVAQTFPFDIGDLLLFYTDGVIEARDPDGTFYPLAERAIAWTGRAPSRLVRTIAADVRRHVGGWPADDMALLAVRRGKGTTTARLLGAGAVALCMSVAVAGRPVYPATTASPTSRQSLAVDLLTSVRGVDRRVRQAQGRRVARSPGRWSGRSRRHAR